MKKIFGIALTWILFSTVSVAQVAATQAKESVDKKECSKTCVPTKECAEKYGMTLEECKKICASKASATASTEDGDNKVASASMVSDVSKAKKACCASKSGATAGCSKTKTASAEETTTKVASAQLVNEVEEVSTEKAKTKKSCSATCSKKKG